MKIDKTIDVLPPSTQHCYGRRKGGGMYLKPEGKAFKDIVAWTFKGSKISKKPFGAEIHFDLKHNRRWDIDNHLKFLLDALSGVVWEDDNQLMELFIYKNRGAKENSTNIIAYTLDD